MACTGHHVCITPRHTCHCLLNSPTVLLIMHHVSAYFCHQIFMACAGHQLALFAIMSPVNLSPSGGPHSTLPPSCSLSAIFGLMLTILGPHLHIWTDDMVYVLRVHCTLLILPLIFVCCTFYFFILDYCFVVANIYSFIRSNTT
jgi:hypothetical protein